MLDAAQYFDGRLPEAFAGYDRELTKYPGAVPDGVQPAGLVDRHAAAAAAHDARPEPQGDHLVVDPALPAGMGRIELLDIPGRWGRVDAFARERVDIGRPPLHQMHGAPRPIV